MCDGFSQCFCLLAESYETIYQRFSIGGARRDFLGCIPLCANLSDNTKNNTSNGARGAKMIFLSGQGVQKCFSWGVQKCKGCKNDFLSRGAGFKMN